jgi:hypothetical protein
VNLHKKRSIALLCLAPTQKIFRGITKFTISRKNYLSSFVKSAKICCWLKIASKILKKMKAIFFGHDYFQLLKPKNVIFCPRICG